MSNSLLTAWFRIANEKLLPPEIIKAHMQAMTDAQRAGRKIDPVIVTDTVGTLIDENFRLRTNMVRAFEILKDEGRTIRVVSSSPNQARTLLENSHAPAWLTQRVDQKPKKDVVQNLSATPVELHVDDERGQRDMWKEASISSLDPFKLG